MHGTITLVQLGQPKIVVEVTQVFLQCMSRVKTIMFALAWATIIQEAQSALMTFQHFQDISKYHR